MTKNKAHAIAKYLATQCDEAHIFVAKCGTACLCDVHSKGDGHTLLTMFFSLIDRTFKSLKAQEQDEFYKLLAAAMKMYIEEEFKPPAKPEENLSDKQRRKRMKSNEKILAAIEEIL